MTPRRWWLGVVLLGLGLLAHAAVPRYEWRAVPHVPDAFLRIDRWTGAAEIGAVRPDWGRWVSVSELRRDAEVKRAQLATTTDAQRRQLDREIDALLQQLTRK